MSIGDQKALSCPLVEGMRDTMHFVRGSATLTTVTRDEIVQRVIHRWPEDKIGLLCT